MRSSAAGQKFNVLTFDVEDWFHILDNPSTEDVESWEKFPSRLDQGLDVILDICKAGGVRATFFILGWVAERYPNAIEKIVRHGHEIGCHSYGHRLVYNQTLDDFRADLERAMDAIEKVAGVRPESYRAPGFSFRTISVDHYQIMREYGIKVDCSIFPARRSHGGIRRSKIDGPFMVSLREGNHMKCLPMSYIDVAGVRIVFSGGGYMRLAPTSILRFLFRSSNYNMIYLHPRDFDPDQPMVPGLNVFRRFKSYTGLSTSKRKLVEILETLSVKCVGQVVEKISWEEADIINIV
jgi:polysaccharide deacetylase family protein (PEP-CTERM system associated)